MVEGRSSSDIKTIKTLISSKPEVFHQLLDILTETTITYLNAQIKAGVDALQLFDTWACYLSWDDFQVFQNITLKKLWKAFIIRKVFLSQFTLVAAMDLRLVYKICQYRFKS